MEDHGSAVLRRLLDQFSGDIRGTHAEHGDATALVDASSLESVMRFLRDDPACDFDMLTDVTCVDFLGEEPRFEMVYHLFSVGERHRLRVKARVPEEAPEIATLLNLWPSANWMEREVWDLYGIRFTGHHDLRRILLNEEIQRHPLRKDYPKDRRQP